MAKGNFSGISKNRRKPEAIDEFVSAAKVDGKNVTKTLVPTRRGKYRVDPKTGEKIALGGKVLEIPLNNEEVAILSQAARNAGLPLATFVRSEAMKAARRSMPTVD